MGEILACFSMCYSFGMRYQDYSYSAKSSPNLYSRKIQMLCPKSKMQNLYKCTNLINQHVFFSFAHNNRMFALCHISIFPRLWQEGKNYEWSWEEGTHGSEAVLKRWRGEGTSVLPHPNILGLESKKLRCGEVMSLPNWLEAICWLHFAQIGGFACPISGHMPISAGCLAMSYWLWGKSRHRERPHWKWCADSQRTPFVLLWDRIAKTSL